MKGPFSSQILNSFKRGGMVSNTWKPCSGSVDVLYAFPEKMVVVKWIKSKVLSQFSIGDKTKKGGVGGLEGGGHVVCGLRSSENQCLWFRPAGV